MKLYELTTSLVQLWEGASSVLDGASDEAEQAKALSYLEEQLKTMEGTHAEKCVNVACLIKNTEAEAEAIKNEEKKLSERRKSAERKAEWLRAYLAGNMQEGVPIKDARAVLTWRKSTSVEVGCKPEELPEILRRTKTIVEADKTAIKTCLENGQEVAGCQLVQKFNLQIK